MNIYHLPHYTLFEKGFVGAAFDKKNVEILKLMNNSIGTNDMDVEPEIILEDGEISNDEDDEYISNKKPFSFTNTHSKRGSNISLEDGEIHGDVDYTPLERPQNFTNSYIPPAKTSDHESDLSSISESDSDDGAVKKPRVKIKSKKLNKLPVKRNKYDIWSSHVQEDVLAETLISCDVSKIDRSRDVESYQAFDLRRKLNGRRQGNKRKHNQRYSKNISSQRRDDSDEDIKGSERVILDLVTNVDNTEEEVSKDIANKLCEEKDDLIMRIVQIAGKEKAIEIFNNVKKIELDGGMLVMNGARRRTPGGVFIFLLKRDDDITDQQQKEIFAEERKEQVRENKAKQKAKLKAIKDQIVAKKAANNKLPLLLSRSDLEVQKSAALRDRNESEPEEFVNNPPPSPVTDGKENSNDGLDIPSYFLDSGSAVDMDIF